MQEHSQVTYVTSLLRAKNLILTKDDEEKREASSQNDPNVYKTGQALQYYLKALFFFYFIEVPRSCRNRRTISPSVNFLQPNDSVLVLTFYLTQLLNFKINP